MNIHLAAIKFFAQVNGYDVSKISTSPKLKRLLKGNSGPGTVEERLLQSIH